ncbi:MAG: DUF2723 domain-containing protein [Bacteroidales bacterium]
MKYFNLLNRWLSWLVFSISAVVYILTVEPTASFWDCGEYIATACKLQVGHPPGAPLFQMMGRFFSLFAMGDVSHIAVMINIMSALASAFTIFFLFRSIALLALKFFPENPERKDIHAVMLAAVTGSLAYTFTDSFWFSAVEGEVYGMSSFFTSVVFWAMLRWEREADRPESLRWILLIAYLMGLSIGVHMLNLLAIPAIVLIFYFRKYKPTFRGFAVALLVSLLLLGFVLNGLIPWVVSLAGRFELLAVNGLGLPFNTGTILYFILLIGGLAYALRYSVKKKSVWLNTALWAIVFILIGYSSFFMLIIRSNANPPIDENNPEDAIGLLSYLNREQYGDWPILYGNYFNAPIVDRKDGSPVYRKDRETGKYKIVDDKKQQIPVYDPEFSTIFPRMWNNTEQRIIDDYKTWSRMKGIPMTVEDESGKPVTLYKPTFAENLRFFFRYQLGHMYWRYFMWNFAGRQDDIQGFSDRKNGNWISGISWLDEARLGPVLDTPPSMANKAQNRFYMLPLLLGLFGLIFQLRRNAGQFSVVAILFLMTGVAIVVYLNQYSPQPRERDYAYAASFYAWAIWIGFGALALYRLLERYLSPRLTLASAGIVSLLAGPAILASQGWDDHDRSNRDTALVMASNYLNSCAPNAILFTNGDNDTFPLWYAQEVEGIRTDVRVVNLSLLNMDWYIDQLHRKAYDADPVPSILPRERYEGGARNFSYFTDQYRIEEYPELRDVMSLLANHSDKLSIDSRFGKIEYFPTQTLKISVDSARIAETGTLPADRIKDMVPEIRWKLSGYGLTKSQLMVLDILAANNWERPIYFSITTGRSAYMGLEPYFQLEGLAYRLIPVRSESLPGDIGSVDTDILYDRLMNDFSFGNISRPDVYLDETHVRMAMSLRNIYSRLAEELEAAGRYDSAVQVIRACDRGIPNEKIAYSYFGLLMGRVAVRSGDSETGLSILQKLATNLDEQLEYYSAFTGRHAQKYNMDIRQNLFMLQKINEFAGRRKLEELKTLTDEMYRRHYPLVERRGT